MTELFNAFMNEHNGRKQETMSMKQFLDLAKEDKTVYATIHERLLKAIGEPNVVDTSKDERLNRIFTGRTIKVYPAFKDFFGIEDTIESVVSFLQHAAQGLEEKRQVLYLLGPVGSAKSSLAERLKLLAEQEPIYVLAANGEVSPVFESPLGLFSKDRHAEMLERDYGIPARYLPDICSPWASKRLEEFGGDVSKFQVVKMMPSRLNQVAISKTEPGDDNNQDISALVGKVDLRKLEDFSQDDTDAYSYSGGLCRGNQGIMEFVEMFKAPIKVLHPILTATQENNYKGTENIPAIPFTGLILAHSNETEWKTFKNNKSNEAFLDRVCVIKVKYNVRIDEEVAIYKKYLSSTDLGAAPCAPETLETLAKFMVLSRLHENPKIAAKVKSKVYNGENIKDTHPNAISITELREDAGVDEGMSGMSTRTAFKILNKTFNSDNTEISADPVLLMNVIESTIINEQFNDEKQAKLMDFLKDIQRDYVDTLGNEIHRAYVKAYDQVGQNQFNRYIAMADAWLEASDYKDPQTGNMYNLDNLDDELRKLERAAEVVNERDFRQEIVTFCLRHRAENGGQNPNWKDYEKMRAVIEKKMFKSIEDILPVISFEGAKDPESEKEHKDFVDRMKQAGYTPNQVRRLVGFYSRAQKR